MSFGVMQDFVTKTIKIFTFLLGIYNYVTFIGIFSAVISRKKKTFMFLISILIFNRFVIMFDGF